MLSNGLFMFAAPKGKEKLVLLRNRGLQYVSIRYTAWRCWTESLEVGTVGDPNENASVEAIDGLCDAEG